MFDAGGHPLGTRDDTDAGSGAHHFYPTPVFAPDGYGYSFDDDGDLVRLHIGLR